MWDATASAADKLAPNHLGAATCTNANVKGSRLVEADKFKVGTEITYWFSAGATLKKTADVEATALRFGEAGSQTYTVTTASGAFAMTLAAGLVATAAVAF